MKASRISKFTLIIALLSVFGMPEIQAKENSLKKGKKALQFEIDSNFDLRSFQGTTLSIKKHTSDNKAYRLGLGVQFEYADGTLERPPYGPGNEPGDRDFTALRFEVNLQKLYYTDNTAPVNAFLGFGPTVSHFYSKDKRDTRNDDNTYIDYLEYQNSTFTAGVSGIVGVEWFINKDISLLAEYGSSILYKATSVERASNRFVSGFQSSQYDYDQTNGFALSSAAVKFGLSVYF